MKDIHGDKIKIDEEKVKDIDINAIIKDVKNPNRKPLTNEQKMDELNCELLQYRRYIENFLDENDVVNMNEKDKKLFIDRLQEASDFLNKTIWQLKHNENYNFDPNDELPF
jgi:hypothetical protein